MSIAVQTDLVPCRDDLGCEIAMALHLLADEEEGGGRLRPREELEDDRRSAWIRTVVKGERNAVLMREATLNSSTRASAGMCGAGAGALQAQVAAKAPRPNVRRFMIVWLPR